MEGNSQPAPTKLARARRTRARWLSNKKSVPATPRNASGQKPQGGIDKANSSPQRAENSKPSQKVDCRGALSFGRYIPLRPAIVRLIELPLALAEGKDCGVCGSWRNSHMPKSSRMAENTCGCDGCGSWRNSEMAKSGMGGPAPRCDAGWHADAVIAGSG